MTLVIVLAVIAGYFAVGAAYARSQALACYRRAAAEWSSQSSIGESTRMQMAWRLAFWPWALVFDAIRGGVKAWFMAPIDRRREQADTLRSDANEWERKRRTGTEAERQMAAELARMCRARAADIDQDLGPRGY